MNFGAGVQILGPSGSWRGEGVVVDGGSPSSPPLWVRELASALGSDHLRAWSLPVLHPLTSNLGRSRWAHLTLLLCPVGQGLAADGGSGLSAMSAGNPGGHKRHPCPGSALASCSLSLSAEGPQRTTGSGPPADLRPTLGITPVEVQLTMLSGLQVIPDLPSACPGPGACLQ